ncbi:hypothetical protein F5887DRAFT_940450 [Amanita rubescens]|nr:hypothetical protein F5887DRAFT_940450 [Amanita rubescens]
MSRTRLNHSLYYIEVGMPAKKHLRQSTLLDFGAEASTSTKKNPRRLSVTSPTQPKRKRPTPDYSSDSDDVGAIRFTSKVPTSGSTRTAVKRRRRIMKVVDSDSGEDVSAVDESDAVPVRKGKRRQVRSNSPDPASRPPTSRKTMMARHQVESDEEEDMEEEVDKDCLSILLYQRLHSLLGKKQGKQRDFTSNSESDGQSETGESDKVKPFKGAKPHDDYGSLFGDESDDSDSSNFIVEDDGNIPQPLPAQFSMETHQDLSHQFKRVFQFFVHIAVRAPLERREFMSKQMKDEEYFSIPLNILRRKILGLRDSLVASSIWRLEFKKSLERYPEFSLTELDYAVPGCDACHLGGRRSTRIGRLGGIPYDKYGFESIIKSRDSDSEDESDRETVIEYSLGRFCGKRTRVYHELTHWEHTLFKCILQEVDELHAAKQSKGFIRVAYEGRRRPPKDLSDADGIL